MTTISRIAAIALTAAAGLALAAPAAMADNQAPCFFVSQWQGWKAPNSHTLLLRVSRSVYEAQLSGDTPLLRDPSVHLVSQFHGTSSVCSPLDLQLEVADTGGMSEPLIVRHLRKLSPEEAAAIPPKFQP